MALRCSAFTLLITITCVHASPQALPRFCQAPVIQGLCRILNVSWHFQCRTKSCLMQPNVLCSRAPSVFLSQKSCLLAAKQLGAKKNLQDCMQMSTVGGCRPESHHWYFDQYQKNCRVFHHRQCTTRGNYFLTEQKCKEMCLRPLKPKIPSQNKIPRGTSHTLKKQEARIH
ncbi:protein AMBP [Rhipicephalus sanguineus]|uniref:protein AMBP n=1 Tax=Rhipicephalus sanguineus TaxID=34632 RepID=UPI0018949DF7|nr:protein AMBP [Rhipicephalus sanguineus]